MKNIFLVINKEKIYAYVVSILTIVTLFFMSSMINSEFDDSQTTSSNIIENNTVINNTIENNVMTNTNIEDSSTGELVAN